MTEYGISITYMVGEKITVKAASFAEAKQKAEQFAESRMEMHDSSEVTYEVWGLGTNEEYAEGSIRG